MAMSLIRSFGVLRRNVFHKAKISALTQPLRALSITSKGKSITREELFNYTHGRFLFNEAEALNRRYVRFDVDQLCAIAAAAGGSFSPIKSIDKVEGRFNKALIMQKEDGSEVVAKIPLPIAGPPKYTTASEVAVLEFINTHTRLPVPKVLAWSSDASNAVGAEYIVMEKAIGKSLFATGNAMTTSDRFSLVIQLTKFEAELASFQFPAFGSLYLCESMTDGESCVALDRKVDPSGKFCIGPSCERAWSAQGKMISPPPHVNNGPWLSLSSFGLALVEREMARIEQQSPVSAFGLLSGCVDQQLAILNMAKEVMSRLDIAKPLIDVDITMPIIDVSQPVLWHTDLCMGNTFIDPKDTTELGDGFTNIEDTNELGDIFPDLKNTPKLSSLIDWQSVVVSPLYLQTRFPEFLSPYYDYMACLTEEEKVPEASQEEPGILKRLTERRSDSTKVARCYELSTANEHIHSYNASLMPIVMRELFIRCGEASEAGAILVRDCLIDFWKGWSELGFPGKCPFSFSEEDLDKHNEQVKRYLSASRVQEEAREMLGADSDGWVSLCIDFADRQKMNTYLLETMMRRSKEYDMTPEEIWSIWPFREKA